MPLAAAGPTRFCQRLILRISRSIPRENLLQLRDINLARVEEEACRELVIRIPPSSQLKHKEEEQALQYANRLQNGAFAASDSPPNAPRPVVHRRETFQDRP